MWWGMRRVLGKSCRSESWPESSMITDALFDARCNPNVHRCFSYHLKLLRVCDRNSGGIYISNCCPSIVCLYICDLTSRCKLRVYYLSLSIKVFEIIVAERIKNRMFIIIGIAFVFLCILDILVKWKRNAQMKQIPGPLSLPLIGTVWMYIGKKPDDLLTMAKELPQQYGTTFKSWVFNILAIYTSDLKDIQEILSSQTLIKKNKMYNLLHVWLGEGLLVSHGPKWFTRRKIITPTFHFKILEQFIEIFDRQSSILAKKLEAHADGQTPFDIHDYVSLATLDIISESAMGTTINAQTDKNCEYVRMLTKLTDTFVKRFVSVLYRSDFLFGLLAPRQKREYDKLVNEIHQFTDDIIEKRKLHIEQLQATLEPKENEFGIKQRMAFLDVLLLTTVDGKPLTKADIREEVDTFMFEGHDTTKSGIGFTLYCISRNPAVQEKMFQEIHDVIGPDPEREITYRDLIELKYTEKVIKEGLRMYPPVPFIGRHSVEDCVINDKIIPKNTSILMGLITLMNDPNVFPEPERFLPERHGHDNPFSFVPFSAGPRNCIGQRFAMLEMKSIITKILRYYELLPYGSAVDPTISVVLKSKTGWQMGFRPRN